MAFGYVDHPPLSIFFLTLIRSLFGEELFVLRSFPAACATATVLVTTRTARRLGAPQAILIDLDNTIVLYDEPALHRQYFQRLASAYAEWYDPETFVERLLRATFGLRQNSGSRSNADRFIDDFVIESGHSREEAWDRFERFYRTE